MSRNPHQVTKDFEAAIGEYTGAPHVVCVNSCTMAILLAVAWHLRDEPNPHNLMRPTPRIPLGPNGWQEVRQAQIEIPKRTYVSVPMAIIHAGGWPIFLDEEWLGFYRLSPLPVWDSARWFTADIFNIVARRRTPGPDEQMGSGMVCVSFHASKTLGLEQGGAILLDDPEADAWLRRARFDGRTEGVAPKDDTFTQIGWHCYLNPSTAAQGILRLHSLPRRNAPLPNDPYPDLSTMEIFK